MMDGGTKPLIFAFKILPDRTTWHLPTSNARLNPLFVPVVVGRKPQVETNNVWQNGPGSIGSSKSVWFYDA